MSGGGGLFFRSRAGAGDHVGLVLAGDALGLRLSLSGSQTTEVVGVYPADEWACLRGAVDLATEEIQVFFGLGEGAGGVQTGGREGVLEPLSTVELVAENGLTIEWDDLRVLHCGP